MEMFEIDKFLNQVNGVYDWVSTNDVDINAFETVDLLTKDMVLNSKVQGNQEALIKLASARVKIYDIIELRKKHINTKPNTKQLLEVVSNATKANVDNGVSFTKMNSGRMFFERLAGVTLFIEQSKEHKFDNISELREIMDHGDYVSFKTPKIYTQLSPMIIKVIEEMKKNNSKHLNESNNYMIELSENLNRINSNQKTI